MPSPLGHILAGVTVATLALPLSSEKLRLKPEPTYPDKLRPKPQPTYPDKPVPEDVRLKADATYKHWFLNPLVVAAAIVAAAPDLDLLVRAWHRKGTHSFFATALVMIVTMAVTGKVTGRIQWRWVLTLGGAHATHLLTDWLGQDPSLPAGIQLLWPFRGEFYKSGVDLFPVTERRFHDIPALILINLWAFLVEIVLLVPVVLAARRWSTRRRRSPVQISDRAVPRQPSA